MGRVPSGRAGGMWLSRRLDAALRGRDQLDRKLQILVSRQQQMQILADRARAEWRSACHSADSWLLRTALLGGQDAVRGAVTSRLLEVDLTWVSELGMTYPVAVDMVGDPVGSLVDGNAALAPTVAAFQAAVAAAVRSAVADEAMRRLERETHLTKRRLRTMEKRWIPWLGAALRERQLFLEQAEQEDAVRTRRALADRPQGR